MIRWSRRSWRMKKGMPPVPTMEPELTPTGASGSLEEWADLMSTRSVEVLIRTELDVSRTCTSACVSERRAVQQVAVWFGGILDPCIGYNLALYFPKKGSCSLLETQHLAPPIDFDSTAEYVWSIP